MVLHVNNLTDDTARHGAFIDLKELVKDDETAVDILTRIEDFTNEALQDALATDAKDDEIRELESQIEELEYERDDALNELSEAKDKIAKLQEQIKELKNG